MNLEVLNKYRATKGEWGSNINDKYGLFYIPAFKTHMTLQVICSPFDGLEEWEHVSVSLQNRCPNWEEMSYIKSLFWSDEQTVIQFHPKKSEYVDTCKTCLHLWRRRDSEHELPPRNLVG